MLTDILNELKPDIAHFHHYTIFGVEAFAIAKRARPDMKIVLTLHEFLAICHNHGQMVKTKTSQLCDKESAIDCNRCFPHLGARDFFLRKQYILTFFKYVDLFISPSHFLAERYIEWGLPREKVLVLENAPPTKIASHAEAIANVDAPSQGISLRQREQKHVRIGYFGQLSPLKGAKVLLDAAKQLEFAKVENITIDIYGDYSNQPLDFQKAVIEALEEASGNVRYHGPYDNSRVHKLMRSVDAVVVPSIWWENSPVVIQEAFTSRRPVICSDIGGMAEAVRTGLDGLWFSVGDGLSLAQLLSEIAYDPDILVKLGETLRHPRPLPAVISAHMEAYRNTMAGA